MNNLKADVTISRNNWDKIYLRINDDTSREMVCEVCLSLEDYAKAITGQGHVVGSVYKDLDIDTYTRMESLAFYISHDSDIMNADERLGE